MSQAKRIVLAARPVGEPKPSDFRLEEHAIPTPGAGEVLLRTIWLSLDPYMRGRMSDGPSYAQPVPVGGVMEAGTVCEVVAAASGAVGSAVGQIAKIKGARAIGIAGGKDKCDYVKNEFGFDDCLDHRDPDLAAKLKAACPKGIDVYFENVGGPVFEAVFPLFNAFARMPVCGLIAHYNDTQSVAPKWAGALMRNVLTKRLTIRGFIVSDFASRHGDFLKDMSAWVRDGKVKYKEHVTEGLENAPDAFMGLLKGANFGKQLVRVGPDKA
ncbi:MAG: NADP-dependent oxidoreductase [Bradyrhizobium sp.]|nr:NADP-dependent oxidoreductase [Bradyrhizobium sp.]